MNRLSRDRCYGCAVPRLQPPFLSAFPGGRRTRRCPQCGISVAGDERCPQCRMLATTALWLEQLMRRRLRAVLVKAVCLLVLVAGLLAGWNRQGGQAAVGSRPSAVGTRH